MVSAPGRIWPRGYCRGVAGLGGAWARLPAGLMPSSVVLGHTVGAWVPVGLLLGLVVIHPVRERRACCRCRPGHQGLLEEDHVF